MFHCVFFCWSEWKLNLRIILFCENKIFIHLGKIAQQMAMVALCGSISKCQTSVFFRVLLSVHHRSFSSFSPRNSFVEKLPSTVRKMWILCYFRGTRDNVTLWLCVEAPGKWFCVKFTRKILEIFLWMCVYVWVLPCPIFRSNFCHLICYLWAFKATNFASRQPGGYHRWHFNGYVSLYRRGVSK